MNLWYADDGTRIGTYIGHNGAVATCDVSCAPCWFFVPAARHGKRCASCSGPACLWLQMFSAALCRRSCLPTFPSLCERFRSCGQAGAASVSAALCERVVSLTEAEGGFPLSRAPAESWSQQPGVSGASTPPLPAGRLACLSAGVQDSESGTELFLSNHKAGALGPTFPSVGCWDNSRRLLTGSADSSARLCYVKPVPTPVMRRTRRRARQVL